MNWGHRFKELFTRNWREKIISLLLAFLFWFMIKAQDERHSQPYAMPPARIAPQSAPPALTPLLPPSQAVPTQLKPTLPPPPDSATGTVIESAEGIGAAAAGL